MKIKKGLTLRHIGKDYVIVVPGQGTVDMTSVYTLNEAAAWLWKQLENKDFTSEMMVDLLMLHYDNAIREQVIEDVKELVDNLVEQGLIIG